MILDELAKNLRDSIREKIWLEGLRPNTTDMVHFKRSSEHLFQLISQWRSRMHKNGAQGEDNNPANREVPVGNVQEPQILQAPQGRAPGVAANPRNANHLLQHQLHAPQPEIPAAGAGELLPHNIGPVIANDQTQNVPVLGPVRALAQIRNNQLQVHINFGEYQDLLAPGENYEEELKVLSKVLAYFSIAVSRIVEHIAQLVEGKYIHAFCTAMQAQLVEKAGLKGIKGEKRCARYAFEDPRERKAREDVRQRIKILAQVSKKLEACVWQ